MFKKVTQNLSFSKYNRYLKYIEDLELSTETKISEYDKKLINKLKDVLEFKIKQVDKLYYILYFFYFATYISFFSFIFSDFFILNQIYKALSKFISFFGTTVFLIGILFTNKLIDFYYEDLTLITAHIISIYSKYKLDLISEFEENNSYLRFIEYFNRRFEKKRIK
jgi:hypothetical protein